VSVFRRRQQGRGPRSRRAGWSPFAVGLAVIAVAVVGTYLGFSKHIPFTHGYRLKAVFGTAQSIRNNSPVRIAGVNVGKVKGVSKAPGADAALVTMELDKRALPIHADATARIRPRIFLEGNFFVDLDPGTPSGKVLHDGDTLPLTQTASSVQLNEVLTALQSDARQDLKDVLDNYGTALTHKPTPAEDRNQDPLVRGKTAAQALNHSYVTAGNAFKTTSIVNEALLGTQPHDLSKLIASFAKVAAALDRNETTLQDLVTNFNTTVGAFASQAVALRRSVHLLAPTLRNADRALADLNRAFPPTRAFAREILPGVRETPATIAAAFPWIHQTRALLGPRELRGLVHELQPTTAKLAHLTDQTITLLPQVDLASRCLSDVVLPSGDVKLDDGPLSSGVANYKEFWYTLVALSGEGQNFDGNGMYVRFNVGGGPFTVSTGKSTLSGDALLGNSDARPIGTRPAFPGKRPPYRPDVPCYTNTPPNLNGPAADLGRGEQVTASSAASPAAAAPGVALPRSGGARAGSRPGGGSVTDELLRRLNPFATAAPRGTAGP
jgi:phospholipid/cholesterol/gamma-HCH transport system substrate-binding protein